MNDAEIAAEIQRRGLQELYLRELAASLGFNPGQGWSDALIRALQDATPEQRRAAAMRTLRHGPEADEPTDAPE